MLIQYDRDEVDPNVALLDVGEVLGLWCPFRRQDFRSFDDLSWLQMLVQSTENKLIINLTVKQ